MIANMRLALMLGIMLPLTVALMPIQYAAIRFGWRLSKNLPRWWHRLLAKMIGLKISVNGELAADRPLMLVCNHVSWSDIIVLGSVAEVCFIAKKEVAKTPFAGLLAMLQRSIFVVREEKRRSADQAREVAERLRFGDVIVLFAEGTTGDGNRLLEFKSSLFAAAQYALEHEDLTQVHIQPVSIAYTRFQGMMMGRMQRTRSAWPGSIELAPHAIGFMRASAWDVEVSFGDPVVHDGSRHRRELAKVTRQRVRDMFIAATYGR